MSDEEKPTTESTSEQDPARDATSELLVLMELAVKYPEIGAPLAQLAFKIGQAELGNRIVRMGLDRPGPGLEFYFVAANAARREKRLADVRRLSVEAVQTFAAAPDSELAPDDGTRLLHLVRLGFATMVFDEKNPHADAWFVEQLQSLLAALEGRFANDAFFHTLIAQATWYADRDRSEVSWDRAAELDDTEFTWNARGTWYKDAERDLEKAERAYRRGLDKAPSSALVLHNLAQLLLDKAGRPEVDVSEARRILREADQHLRNALRGDSPKGLRRHVHETREALDTLRSSLPGHDEPKAHREPPRPAEPERMPEPGEVIRGRVVSLTAFGAFISLPGAGVGLLHKSEISHDRVEDPAAVLKVGDEIEVKVVDVSRKEGTDRTRIGLSRKALLPAPPRLQGSPQPRAQTEARPQHRDNREDRPRQGAQRQQSPSQGRGQRDKAKDDKLASLGEMLLAKLKSQGKDSL